MLGSPRDEAILPNRDQGAQLPMIATARTLAETRLGIEAGKWRWTALGFLGIAVGAGAVAAAKPIEAGLAGIALLAGIGALGSLLMFALRPRERMASLRARRIAEAAARANVAWVITAHEGHVIDCNDVYRRMAGADGKDLPAPPELAFAGEASAAVLYRLARSAAAGEPREETVNVAPGLEVVVAVKPIKDRQTAWWFTPRLATAGARDALTSAAKAGATGASEIWRDAPMGVAVADADGTILDANASFERFFAKPARGRKLASLLEPADLARVNALLMGVAGETGAVELKGPGSDERMGELIVRREAEGKRAILYLLDVSEQRALETKFAQSQKMQAVGQLAGGVAHDFNNLLTVIIGNCEFLLMRHQASDPSFKEINEIHQNALRAATLVGQLLAFSRKQTLQPRTLNMRDTIGELAIMLRRLIREGMELKLDQSPALWPVHADEAQLSNAIINLVVNARDAMGQAGTVTIRTTNESVAHAITLGSAIMPPGDYVRIDVADTGHGIAKEHLGKIFDPFFTTKPVGQGTGLGLATVYGIVKQTGGFITLDSEEGRGTTFTIYLPRHHVDPNVSLAEPERLSPRDVTGQETILLVEDEEAVRSFAARALKLRGYNVIEASGGEEALEIVRTNPSPIRLLITDVVMPMMDGPTLVRNVRALKPEIRIIFMSGYAEETFRRNDEKVEDLHFLPKPFGLKQLAAKVKEVLSAGEPGAS